MRLLFAITVLCFCAVLWVALALARRIRLGQVLTAKPKTIRRAAAREFFEAGEFRTPRPLHLDQEIFKQKPRRPLAEITYFADRPVAASLSSASSRSAPERTRTSGPTPIRSSTAYATLFGQSMSIAQIDSYRKSAPYTSPEAAVEAKQAVVREMTAGLPPDFVNSRIPPQPERVSGLRRRIDLSHFNKDMGDLTDPYTNHLRGSGTQGPAPADNRFGYKH